MANSDINLISNYDIDETNLPHESRKLAIKIFTTSIMIFKDREEYINGDFRFRSFYRSKGTNNPRKLVKLWAEKE